MVQDRTPTGLIDRDSLLYKGGDSLNDHGEFCTSVLEVVVVDV